MRTNERAVIELPDAKLICAIRDRSPEGARIVLKERQNLPETFWLVSAVDGRRIRARLIWTDGLTAGVRLETEG